MLVLMGALIAWIAGVIPHGALPGGAAALAGYDEIVRTILKLAALVPLAIGVRIFVKNLAVNRLVREEYSHKASLSTALEGYRSLMTTEGEQKALVKDTMEKMYRNPAESLEESGSEGDVTKIAQTIADSVMRIVRGSAPSNSAS